MYTYLLINLFSVLFPFVFSFHPKLNFYKKFGALFPAMILTAVVFIAWDMLYTQIGVWGFNGKYLTGITLFNLPFEEVLVFICIPFASIFIYEALLVFKVKDYFRSIEKKITNTLIAALTFFAIIHYERLYTTVTFGACVLFLLFLSAQKAKYLSRFYFAYLIILLPFFIVNGLLTGTGLEEPVVWYNNRENMGVRLLSIPLEDVFYGMLMLLMSVYFYERKLKRF